MAADQSKAKKSKARQKKLKQGKYLLRCERETAQANRVCRRYDCRSPLISSMQLGLQVSPQSKLAGKLRLNSRPCSLKAKQTKPSNQNLRQPGLFKLRASALEQTQLPMQIEGIWLLPGIHTLQSDSCQGLARFVKKAHVSHPTAMPLFLVIKAAKPSGSAGEQN